MSAIFASSRTNLRTHACTPTAPPDAAFLACEPFFPFFPLLLLHQDCSSPGATLGHSTETPVLRHMYNTPLGSYHAVPGVHARCPLPAAPLPTTLYLPSETSLSPPPAAVFRGYIRWDRAREVKDAALLPLTATSTAACAMPCDAYIHPPNMPFIADCEK